MNKVMKPCSVEVHNYYYYVMDRMILCNYEERRMIAKLRRKLDIYSYTSTVERICRYAGIDTQRME